MMATTELRSAIRNNSTAYLYSVLGDLRQAPDSIKRARAIAVLRAELLRRGA